MVVHLFPQEKFTVPFIKFINSTFNVNEHLFIVHGKNDNYKKYEVEQYNNIIYVNRDNKNNIIEVIKYINKADKVIIHSLFIPNWLKYYLLISKTTLKKSNWVIWGADLYLYKIRNKNLKSDLNEVIRRRIISNLGGLITHIKGDYELAKEWYGAKGKYVYSFMYPSNLYNDYNLPKSNINNNGTIYIQIGNSADPTNNHLDIFKKLENYLDKNIKIICPLSYGDEDYKNKVINEGKRIFGNKFSPLLNFMNSEEYLEILSKIDVAIFNHKRQQAVGNITSLLGFGKKVYIRSDITTWEFCKAHDLTVFDATTSSNDLLTPLDLNDNVKNIESVKKYFSKEKLILDLQEIFKN
ncbi:TDP-N-acetylfucosamine:lipid II N-acetylfucosaminyltransferase [Clostridium sartagoforme]|uniref:TDP-N-acetylfucosamine:lipid II N-acetylfucosaminyltransferase n=1 Tax=Clostridium sartagoforme TaxID=84031 RepID=UPI0031DB475E